jgi:protein N-lysine methyltransferase METTL21D
MESLKNPTSKQYFPLFVSSKFVPFMAQMDIKYQHPSIQLYMMELKALPKCDSKPFETANLKISHASDEDRDVFDCAETRNAETSTPVELKILIQQNGKLDDWEIRRCGAMAARLLRDVELS